MLCSPAHLTKEFVSCLAVLLSLSCQTFYEQTVALYPYASDELSDFVSRVADLCCPFRPKTFDEQTVALSPQDKQTLEQNMASYTIFPLVSMQNDRVAAGFSGVCEDRAACP
jgi:hypothetical protein